MKHKKGKIFQALNFALPFILGAAVIVIVLIFISLHFRSFIVGLFPVSVPEQSVVVPPAVPVLTPVSTESANGSFTELFSGSGWMNSEKTNVYQDDKLSSISFPPDYEWQEIPALSDSIKNETIIAANGNGREVVLVTKSGKIMSLRGAAGNEAISINQSSIIPAHRSLGEGGNNQLRSAFLDYDDTKQTWVVAAVSENGEGFIGPIGGHISPISFGGSQSSLPADLSAKALASAEALAKVGIIDNQLDLVCANGECLLLSGSTIYRFAESDPSALIRVDIRVSPLLSQENPRESASMLSLGKAGNILLVGIVEKSGDEYTGNIFKYSASASPEPSAKAGGSLQLLMINDQSLFSSSYPGTIRFGYDSEKNEILALYAAYIGQAYKFSVNHILSSFQSAEVELPLEVQLPNIENPRESASTSDDFSRFFPQRVMDGNNTPKIFKHGNAWWLSSEVEQLATKFIRIEGGAGIDFADTLIRGQQAFELLPGFSANELYALAAGQDGAKIYKFIDKGYKKDKKLVWESLRLNRFDDEIVSGRFYKIQGSEEDASSVIASGDMKSPPVIASGAKQSQGNIRVNPLLNESNPRLSASILYYLSNDGGKNWREAKLNEKIDFQTKGNDFRFKVELSPDADVSQTPRESASTAKTIRVNPPLNFQTPWLNLISVEYYSKP